MKENIIICLMAITMVGLYSGAESSAYAQGDAPAAARLETETGVVLDGSKPIAPFHANTKADLTGSATLTPPDESLTIENKVRAEGDHAALTTMDINGDGMIDAQEMNQSERAATTTP